MQTTNRYAGHSIVTKIYEIAMNCILQKVDRAPVTLA